MLLKRKATARALDVGCGIGRHVAYLARNGIDTYGFDLSEKAIAEAETLLKKEGVKAHLSVGDMFKRFPFGNGFFDAVVATRTLHHGYLREIKRAIREIDRVVSDGGYVFVQSTLWSKGDKIQNPKAVEVEPRTLIWSDGEEANIPHHFFTKEELILSFENYEILNLHAKTEHYGGWCLLAKKKT
jgi:SAM-dependent methyltransferase